MFPGGPGILCGLFSLDVSPALYTTISLRGKFLLMMVRVREAMHVMTESSVFVYRNKQTSAKTWWVSYIVVPKLLG